MRKRGSRTWRRSQEGTSEFWVSALRSILLTDQIKNFWLATTNGWCDLQKTQDQFDQVWLGNSCLINESPAAFSANWRFHCGVLQVSFPRVVTVGDKKMTHTSTKDKLEKKSENGHTGCVGRHKKGIRVFSQNGFFLYSGPKTCPPSKYFVVCWWSLLFMFWWFFTKKLGTQKFSRQNSRRN